MLHYSAWGLLISVRSCDKAPADATTSPDTGYLEVQTLIRIYSSLGDCDSFGTGLVRQMTLRKLYNIGHTSIRYSIP